MSYGKVLAFSVPVSYTHLDVYKRQAQASERTTSHDGFGRAVFGTSGERDSGPAMGRLQFRESLGSGSEKRGGRQGGRCEDGIFKGRCSARCSSGRGAVKLARCFILPARHRLGFCQSGNGKAVPPGELAEKAAPAGCEAGRVGRGHWVAHIPTYLSLVARRNGLDQTGAPMKVQQELMRHALIQTTMNVYGRPMTETKRRANSQVVGLVFGPNSVSYTHLWSPHSLISQSPSECAS